MQCFDLAHIVATPWKNGGGQTQEIVCLPPGSNWSNFAWRVSVAQIAVAGEFSKFDGVDRVLMLWNGPGLDLHIADPFHPSETVLHALRQPLQGLAFAGEAHVTGVPVLANQAVNLDLNVMTRRQHLTSHVQVISEAFEVPAGCHCLVLVASGQWEIASHPQRLGQGQGMWWQSQHLVHQVRPVQSGQMVVAMAWPGTASKGSMDFDFEGVS